MRQGCCRELDCWVNDAIHQAFHHFSVLVLLLSQGVCVCVCVCVCWDLPPVPLLLEGELCLRPRASVL